MNNPEKMIFLCLLIGLALTAISYYKITDKTLVTVPNCITLEKEEHGFPLSYYETDSNIGICTVAVTGSSFNGIDLVLDFVTWSLLAAVGVASTNYVRRRK